MNLTSIPFVNQAAFLIVLPCRSQDVVAPVAHPRFLVDLQVEILREANPPLAVVAHLFSFTSKNQYESTPAAKHSRFGNDPSPCSILPARSTSCSRPPERRILQSGYPAVDHPTGKLSPRHSRCPTKRASSPSKHEPHPALPTFPQLLAASAWLFEPERAASLPKCPLHRSNFPTQPPTAQATRADFVATPRQREPPPPRLLLRQPHPIRSRTPDSPDEFPLPAGPALLPPSSPPRHAGCARPHPLQWVGCTSFARRDAKCRKPTNQTR